MAAPKKGAKAKGPQRGAHFKVEGDKITTAKKYCRAADPVS